MKLADARKLIQLCLIDADAAYGDTLFDEWMIVWMAGHHRDIVHYSGPRFDKAADFQADMQPLKQSFEGRSYHVGDLEFARDGEGTGFDAILMAGVGAYVIFNHTEKCLLRISHNSAQWRQAQIPLVKLADAFGRDPLQL